jgi:hypothetical protein
VARGRPPLSSLLGAVWHVTNDEVGHRRGTLRPFSDAPFPNEAGKFPCTSLSRASGFHSRTKKGLTHCTASQPQAECPLAPATLGPVDDLLVLLGGASLPRLLRWLSHHLPCERKVIPWYVTMKRKHPVGSPLIPLAGLIGRSPPRGRLRASWDKTHSEQGIGFRRLPMGVGLLPMEIGLRAV